MKTTLRQPPRRMPDPITRALESAIWHRLEATGRPAELSWLVKQFTPGFTAAAVRAAVRELTEAGLLTVYAGHLCGRVLVTISEDYK